MGRPKTWVGQARQDNMLAAALTLVSAQALSPQEVARRQDAFGVSALLAVAKPGQNTVISPNNLLYALAGLYPASSGASRAALEKALGGPVALETLKVVFTKPGQGDEQLETAAAAWVDDEIAPLRSYITSVKSGLGYDVRNLDLQSPAALPAINGWVNDSTHGKIPSILEQLPRESVLVLTSALYYKAPWTQKMLLMDDPLLFGPAKSPVKAMQTSGEMLYTSSAEYHGVRVPFKGDGYVEFFVPKGTATPESVAKSVGENAPKFVAARVNLKLPLWKTEFNSSVKDMFAKVGLQPILEDRDEFQGIAKDVCVLDAFHRTWVDMNENGVEAAAATAIVVGRTSAPAGDPVEFSVDRPFYVVIRKRSTGAALFMGFVYEPTRA